VPIWLKLGVPNGSYGPGAPWFTPHAPSAGDLCVAIEAQRLADDERFEVYHTCVQTAEGPVVPAPFNPCAEDDPAYVQAWCDDNRRMCTDTRPELAACQDYPTRCPELSVGALAQADDAGVDLDSDVEAPLGDDAAVRPSRSAAIAQGDHHHAGCSISPAVAPHGGRRMASLALLPWLIALRLRRRARLAANAPHHSARSASS